MLEQQRSKAVWWLKAMKDTAYSYHLTDHKKLKIIPKKQKTVRNKQSLKLY